MGKRGKEIVQAELNVKDVVNELNKAIASEWAAAYFYWVASKVLKSFHGEEVAEYFEEQVEDELGHASKLAKRVSELGGVPVDTIGKIESLASEKLTLPRDFSDAEAFIQKALELEGNVIEYYNKLAKKYFGKDYVSFQLVSEILASEVSEEEALENLQDKRN
jgi:bacterioferritin